MRQNLRRRVPIRSLISQRSRQDALRYGVAIGTIVAVLMIGVMGLRLFEQAQLIVTNVLYTDAAVTNQVAIVAIDDLTLGAYGRSIASWPRTRHADLIRRLAEAGARVVVMDIVFDSPGTDDAALADAIAAARRTPAGTRVVLAVSGRQGTASQAGNGRLTYESVLRPLPALTDAGAATGHVNVTADADGYVRRIPLLMNAPTVEGGPDQQWLSLSAAAYLSYLRIPESLWAQVVKVGADTIRLTDQRVLPVGSGARMITDFFGPTGTFPAYSYSAVVDQQIDPAAFQGKIVLVGALNATGITDRYLVPNGRGGLMAGVEIHANALETILQNKPLVEVSGQDMLLAVLVISFLSASVFMQFRSVALLAAFAILLFGLFTAASVLFSVYNIILSVAYPAMALFLTLIFSALSNVQVEIRQRTRVQAVLNSLTRLSEQRLLLNAIVPPLIDEARGLLNAEQAAIWQWNETRGEVSRLYGWLGALPPATPVRVRHIASVPDSTAWGVYDMAAFQATQTPGIVEFEGAILVALRHSGRLTGVLGVGRPRNRRFNHVQRDLLVTFAEATGPVLANAQTYTAEQQQRELIESILAGSPDPILVLDGKLRLTRANAAAANVSAAFNLSLPRQSRITIDKALQNAGIAAEIAAEVAEHLRQDEPPEREIRIGERTFNLLGAPLTITEGAWVLVLNDISSLKDLDNLKTQMIRMASHDLKNPLSVILGYLDLLLSGPMEDPQNSLLVIQDAARRMNRIISDIMDIERFRNGRLNLTPTDLAELIRDVIGEYQNQVRERQQILVNEAPESLVVLIDPQQIREAVSNLVGNAIKYTRPGGQISLRLRPATAGIHFEVSDTGLGIAKAAQANLFKPFYRVRTKATAGIEGTGLGLSIVKAVIDAHGGQIRFESEEGKGTTFFVDLPSPPIRQPELAASAFLSERKTREL